MLLAVSMTKIPSRAEVSDRLLPSRDAPGVDAGQAAHIEEALRKQVVRGIDASLATGQSQVTATLRVQLPASNERFGYGRRARPSSDTMRAALRPVVDELLQQGFYNVTFQVISGLATLDARTYGAKPSGAQDTLRLRFDMAGEKRFDVDWETSGVLSSHNDVQRAHFFRDSRGTVFETGPNKSWDRFVNGRGRIIENENGML